MSAEIETETAAEEYETRPRRSKRRREAPEEPPRERRRDGRRARTRARRRRRVLRGFLGLVGLVLLAATAIVVAPLLPERRAADDPDGAIPDGAEVPLEAATLVFATFDEQAPNAGASVIFALGEDGDGRGTLLLVPSATIADIPGHGLERVGRAFAYGRGPLLDATLGNLLGIAPDATVAVSEQGWAALVNRIGGLVVEVPERLVLREEDGSGEVRFQPGAQHLDGVRVAELIGFQVAGESELDRLARVRRVFAALIAALAEDPEGLDAIFADGAPMLEAPIEPERLRAVLAAVIDAQAAGELDVLMLPVSPLTGGEEGSYRIDRDRADALVAERFPRAVHAEAVPGARRLQILNGNGRPGIGQQVAERVLPAGFRVVLTDNADRFDHELTRILVHDDSDEQIALARELERLIGVGRVEISRAPQSVVDFTVVVGHDFLEVVGGP